MSYEGHCNLGTVPFTRKLASDLGHISNSDIRHNIVSAHSVAPWRIYRTQACTEVIDSSVSLLAYPRWRAVHRLITNESIHTHAPFALHAVVVHNP